MRDAIEEVRGTIAQTQQTQLDMHYSQLVMYQNQQANKCLMEMMVRMVRGLEKHMQIGPKGLPTFPIN